MKALFGLKLYASTTLIDEAWFVKGYIFLQWHVVLQMKFRSIAALFYCGAAVKTTTAAAIAAFSIAAPRNRRRGAAIKALLYGPWQLATYHFLKENFHENFWENFDVKQSRH